MRIKEILKMKVMKIKKIDNGYNKNGNDKNGNDNKYRVYKCDSGASEYKPPVIKLDLTTPVKF